MSLSVQLYSVREALADDPLSTLRRLQVIGVETVELFGFVDDQERYAETLAAAGMHAVSGHNGLVGADDVSVVFDAAVRLGITTVIEPAVREGWDSAEGVAAIAARLNQLAPGATDRGLTLGYHNHWWEFADLDGRLALEVFAEQLDPGIVLEVDTYWAQVAGVSAPELLLRLGDRVQFIHVKDGPIDLVPSSQLPAGAGLMDVAAVLKAAPQASRVLEFDEYAGDIFEGLAASYAYVTSLEASA